jgi:alpha-beta hydrolase superfamily lysophospholipase
LPTIKKPSELSGGGHEMLNETNRSEVMADLLLWISKVLRW